MIKTIIWFIRFIFSLIMTIPSLNRVKKLDIPEKWFNANEYTQKWCDKMLKNAGVEVEVVGIENLIDKPTVYIGNHSGFFDVPIMIHSLPSIKAFVSKIENKKIPIVRKWMEEIGCVFIDRDNIRQQVKAIDLVKQNLHSGLSYVIFPEGTRSEDGKLGEFKPGALKFATRAEAIVQPFAIIGSNEIMKKGNPKINTGIIKVVFGKSIVTDKSMNKDTVLLTNKVRQEVESLMNMQIENKEQL